MLKTLIFDLGKVIIPFDFQRAYAHMEKATGLTIEEIRSRIRTTGLVEPFERGEIEPDEFVERLTAGVGFKATTLEFGRLWGSIFMPDTLLPEELFVELKQRHRLLLLSNTNALHFELVVAEYPLLRHFDHFVLSYKVGAMKPDPRIYEEALRHAECAPEECFFTDDIEANVAGARALGIHGVVFENRAQLEEELVRRGALDRAFAGAEGKNAVARL